MDTVKRWGFIAAGLANIVGVLLFSQLFSNQALVDASPVVMSRFGLLMIIIWGLAYIAVSRHYQHLRALVLVFAIEKLAYTLTWVDWLADAQSVSLASLFSENVLAGTFMAVYGPNDFIFMVFFSWVFLSTRPGKEE